MTFQKYNTRNNAFGHLIAGINASAVTMQLNPGEGDRFANNNMILTLTQYTVPSDPTSEIVKEESVFVTNRSGDVFTITRGFGGDTPTSFNTGDWVYLSVRAEHIQDLQDESTRLESDKLNRNNQLRTGNGAWRTSYNNGSGNEVELALGTAGRVLQSNGATSAPTWEVPTVNITGLTQRATPDMDADEFVVGGTPNEKVKLSDYKASDAEATAGVVTDKFVTPAQTALSVGTTESITKSTSSTTSGTDVTSVVFAENRDLTINVGITIIVNNAAGDTVVRVRLQVSDDNTSWSNIDTVQRFVNGQNYESFSYILKKGKYARIESFAAGGGLKFAQGILRHQKA